MAQPTTLIVCPTSHMDWDWISSFDEYYKTSSGGAGTGPVQTILNAAIALFQTESSSLFSLAEMGWFQRYLVDQGGVLPSAPDLPKTLCLLGGAITTPDNIVCDGEVFVRAYLVGWQWARSVGMAAALENVGWMPDNFGHDPELPVILAAMGFTSTGFARVPGAFPNYNSPLGGNQPSLACTLMAQGVAFNWLASDGSLVFAHFMPDTYGVPFTSSSAQANSDAWADFVRSTYLSSYPCQSIGAVVWPGDIAFAPAGGDFAVPDSDWVNGVATFNAQQSVTTAAIDTFPNFVAKVLDSGASLATMQIDPSNFWTGFFGSRPALKTLQASASRHLVSAEMVSSLLHLGAVTSGAALDALDGAITQVWNILAPSSHHDFITGTSPDRVYKMEQYPMAALAARLAEGTYRQALQIVADSIPASSQGTPMIVFNPVATQRGGVVELERGSAVSFGGVAATVQPIAGGRLLAQVPAVQSLGYLSGLVTLGDSAAPPEREPIYGDVILNNGTIDITISASQNWAIISIMQQGVELLPSGTLANQIQIYSDSGNLYQYGNEYGAGGTFRPQSNVLTTGSAWQTEFGPLRWRVEAELLGPNGIVYTLVYTLVAGESLVRMQVTGSAPLDTTVVTTFPAVASDGVTPGTHLTYGTAHHYHEDAAPAYWSGPTFKATHDFLMPTADGDVATFDLAAIYHDGMPAWACEQGLLLGSLFRNADGGQRGAAGTDYDTHTQHYALRVSTTPLYPAQGTPLVESLQYMRPLRAAIASDTNVAESPVTLPTTGSLASAAWPALIRAARPMGEVPSPTGTAPQAQVSLRVYRPDADGSSTTVAVTMPVLTAASKASAELVTALEQPIANAPAVGLSGDVLSVPTNFALTTVMVTATRPITIPTNGK